MTNLVYILNGPNLNLLGTREPEIYGRLSLDEINKDLQTVAESYGFSIICQQSNREGELIDWIHEAGNKGAGLILNAGAFSHTSIALADAIRSVNIPTIEVHLSNIYQREEFRRHSTISEAAIGVICGFGPLGYRLALEVLSKRRDNRIG